MTAFFVFIRRAVNPHLILGTFLISTIFYLAFATTAVADEAARPLVGAIRWDAWTGGSVTEQVERTLRPRKYHDRLPWFAEIVGDNKVRIDGSPQSVMDREIDFAAHAGLDYWAFLIYPKENPMSVALEQYLRSERREQVKFCMILHNTLNANEANWPAERDRAIALMKEPGYVTVLEGRPLVYAFTGRGFPFTRFAEFLKAAHAADLNPYCVFMGWNPAADWQRVSRYGFNAFSAYARGGDQADFSELVESTERYYWENAARANVPYIPMVTTGWDKRPRKDNPVSWEKDHGYHKQEVFPSKATPEQIATHLSRAIKFVESHPNICTARAIIIYAWNEHDEGGWLTPTLGSAGEPDTVRLDAIRRVLIKSSSNN